MVRLNSYNTVFDSISFTRPERDQLVWNAHIDQKQRAGILQKFSTSVNINNCEHDAKYQNF